MSNFEVGLFKQKWCLSDLVFDGEFRGGIFIFVDGLKLPKIAIQILSYVVLAFFWQFVDHQLTNCLKIWQGYSKYRSS